MEISVMSIWLVIAVLCMAAEALGITGVGLLFAGFGAFTVGGLISLGVLSAGASLAQAVVFLAASAAWAVILWKPIQTFRLNRRSHGYSNIVGDTAYVGSAGLRRAGGGEVTWSGTIMKAELDPSVALEKLEAGSEVTITGVKGATLVVKPK